MFSARYIVNDVDASVRFYRDVLGFEVVMHPGPGFAQLSRGELTLLLTAQRGPGGASQAMPDGRVPEPGGWNRFQMEVNDLQALVETLRGPGASFRNDIVNGNGGLQILVDDPSRNPIELFQPHRSR